jgi:hypothetical protein
MKPIMIYRREETLLLIWENRGLVVGAMTIQNRILIIGMKMLVKDLIKQMLSLRISSMKWKSSNNLKRKMEKEMIHLRILRKKGKWYWQQWIVCIFSYLKMVERVTETLIVNWLKLIENIAIDFWEHKIEALSWLKGRRKIEI